MRAGMSQKLRSQLLLMPPGPSLQDRPRGMLEAHIGVHGPQGELLRRGGHGGHRSSQKLPQGALLFSFLNFGNRVTGNKEIFHGTTLVVYIKKRRKVLSPFPAY